ncbi:putative Zinc finger protein 143 [Hypsibius exemplaris]|uniref:Zinc finger protein 143 n=1 Tax=Hypsibius exemplaris TaxID=2072580 RepID=A0A9X6RJT5_HYPEX|nr:putative Zinc finger protein 143 [Hypsibius exemplaris]
MERFSQTERDLDVRSCVIPGCKFTTWSGVGALKAHLVVHSAERPFVCAVEGCVTRHKTNAALRIHEKTHTGDNVVKRFRCTYKDCPFEGWYAEQVRRHIMRVHTGEKPFKCNHEGCTYASVTRHQRDYHMMAHTGYRPNKCPHPNCGYSTIRPSDLRSHVAKHQDVRSHFCTWSGCTFRGAKSVASLRAHVRLHTHPRRGGSIKAPAQSLQCLTEGCGFVAASKTTLYQHQRLHSGDNRFSCDRPGCEFRGARLITLERHKHREHGEIPKYQCYQPGCTFRAATSADVRVHQSIHGGPKRLHRRVSTLPTIAGKRQATCLVGSPLTGDIPILLPLELLELDWSRPRNLSTPLLRKIMARKAQGSSILTAPTC